jgi:histidyl-tRNA synthetase
MSSKNLELRPVRGMRDFLPKDLTKRRFVEDKVRELFLLYGYREVETPVLEYLDLLAAKVGDEIRHRMYAFKDLGDRWVAMRPEMTAPVARLVSTKMRTHAKPLRLGYVANCFRYDNPQKGRYREFWHAGFELFGSDRPESDAEILCVTSDLMRNLGFNNFQFKINNIGILRAIFSEEGLEDANQNLLMSLIDKNKINEVFQQLTNLNASNVCKDVLQQLFQIKGVNSEEIIVKGKSVVKAFDSAVENLDNLEKIIKLVRNGGVKAPLLIDLGFARGLEYYTGMIFEVTVPHLDLSLVGGGRYDGLVELYGGDKTPAVGCAPGISRIVLAMEEANLFVDKNGKNAVLVTFVNDDLIGEALRITDLLRTNGIFVLFDVMGRGIRRALSQASTSGCSHTIIVGQDEMKRQSVVLRNLIDRSQKEVKINDLIHELSKNVT